MFRFNLPSQHAFNSRIRVPQNVAVMTYEPHQDIMELENVFMIVINFLDTHNKTVLYVPNVDEYKSLVNFIYHNF